MAVKKSPEKSNDDLFDSLFRDPVARPAEEVWTVSKLSSRIKQVVEDGLPMLWVEGEISNYKLHSSGHRYFTLKDEQAQISCVMWRTRQVPSANFGDGLKVKLFGRVTVWEQAGKYQFDVQSLLLAGAGSLQAAFEALKSRLAGDGIFDISRKKSLPRFPGRIGIITSPTGAVIHDLAWGITTRYPPAKILLYPVPVQGEGAAAMIAASIDFFNKKNLVDILVVGRGGGSLEDLWAFNEEVVVRAIDRSIIPVVSAVGHEVDWTLSDLVADVRAPTPTAAAALIVPDRKELLTTLRERGQSLVAGLERQISLFGERINRIRQSYGLKRLPGRINDERLRLDEISRRQESALERLHHNRKSMLTAVSQQIAALSPDAVLKRGFTIVRHGNGLLVRSSRALSEGERVRLLFASGSASATITEIEHA